jgi:hypothetical protein
MNKNLTAALLVLLSFPVWAAEWTLISETEDPDKITSWYVDMTSIVHEDDYMRAFLRTTWSAPQYGPDKSAYQSSTYLNYFDCDARKIAFTANTYFVSPVPDGLPIHEEAERKLEKLQFQPVVPGSAGESRLEFVCKYRSKNFLTQRSDGIPIS